MKSQTRIVRVFLIWALCISCLKSNGQPTDGAPGDPGAVIVSTVQHLSFGAFSAGTNGGTISIAPNGSRSVTGDIIPYNLNIAYFNAIFEIEAPKGTIISVLNGPDVTLKGSNGGSMSMRIGNADPPSPFITNIDPPGRTRINIGGTITVGSASNNPPGSYSGSFYITFNHE